MSEFKYVCIPVRSEQEGIETAEDVIGAMMWNNDEHKRPQAWPYDNDNPIIVMDSPLLLEKQLAEAKAEIERKDKLIEQMRRSLEWALSFPVCTCYDHDTRHQDQQTCSCGHADRVQRAMAALEAAERGE